jgi:preprotein translocase subunit SecA/nephrocystin-3
MNPKDRTSSSQSGNRQIRVFISSTFRDMQADRDYLVKFVFPQLRKLCESRGVTWGEVDLRWGVTDEQAAEGKVLPICLEEIKRCHPVLSGCRTGVGEQVEVVEFLPSVSAHGRRANPCQTWN